MSDMKTASKAEKLRQKMAAIEEQLKAAERAEREQKREAEKRERRRRERAVISAAAAAGLLGLTASRESLEAEFREIAKRLEASGEDEKNGTEEHQEERDGPQNFGAA
jgi:hypothetical protein